MQPMIPPKRFDICFPLTEGCSEGLGAFLFFFKNITMVFYCDARYALFTDFVAIWIPSGLNSGCHHD